jgi:hypothetical protein
MDDNEKCCGTCKYHCYDDEYEWLCTNDISMNYQNWTEYEDKCEDWESRKDG